LRSAPPSRRAQGGWGSSDEEAEAEEDLSLAPPPADPSADLSAVPASSIPLADWYDLLGYTLALCDGPTLRRVARCSKQLHALAEDTLRCASWRARLSTEADVEARVALVVVADKVPLLPREWAGAPATPATSRFSSYLPPPPASAATSRYVAGGRRPPH
jgi:hypothetical protein